jgi:hypothetical protein
VFSNAYTIPSPDDLPNKAVAIIDHVIQPLVDDPPSLDVSSMERCHAALIERPGFGSFLAGQVVADLRWAVQGPWEGKDRWAPQGPGSAQGLHRLDGRKGSAAKAALPRVEFDRRFARVLDETRRRLPADLVGRLEAMDIQNCLCEFAKFEKALWGEKMRERIYRGRLAATAPTPAVVAAVPAAPPPAPPGADATREASPPAPAARPSLLTQLRLAGLPEPEFRFAPPRRWRWDLCWPDRLVAVEVQGGTFAGGRHTRGKGYRNDCEKLNEGQLLGWLVLWVTPPMVKDGSALPAELRRNLQRLNCP